MWSNLHTHSHYCDGKGTLSEYVEAARNGGMVSIGFSSHAPIPGVSCKWTMKMERLPEYLREIEKLKTVSEGIEIYKGLEIDFIPGKISPNDYRHTLDYTIGSVHFVDAYEGTPWEIDGAHEGFRIGLNNIFRNDMRAALTRYYELTRQMVLQSPPDVVGHLDKIKIQNKPDTPFDESAPWYQEEIGKTLKVIQEAGVIVEVNTRGIYQKKSEHTYPSPWILERIHQMGIPVTLSSDAHHKDDLINQFQPTARLLTDIGFKRLSFFKGGTWNQLPFNLYGIS
jgi:histidinol-phosphatase (PHP family)